MKTIVVTGTPGTGKTVLAKKLANNNKYVYIDVKKLVKTFKLALAHDRKRDSDVVDLKKLNKVLVGIIDVSKQQKVRGVVIDSHLAHYLPKKYVDLCIVTRTEPKQLYVRLKKRGYSASKIAENMEAEIMQVILEEAREQKHRIKVVWT